MMYVCNHRYVYLYVWIDARVGVYRHEHRDTDFMKITILRVTSKRRCILAKATFPRGLTPLLSLNRHSNTGIVISIVIFIVLLFPAASSSEFPGRSPSARYHLDTPPSPPRPQNRARRPRTSLGRQMRVSGRRSGDTTMARRRHQRHRVPAPLVWRRRAGMIAASSDTSSPPRATCPDILLDLVLA